MSSPGGAVSGAPLAASGDRTRLAWQRTAFSLLAGAAALSRLTSDRLGTAALVGLAITALLLLWVVAVALGRRGRTRDRDGGPAAALCAGIVVVGLTEIAAVVIG